MNEDKLHEKEDEEEVYDFPDNGMVPLIEVPELSDILEVIADSGLSMAAYCLSALYNQMSTIIIWGVNTALAAAAAQPEPLHVKMTTEKIPDKTEQPLSEIVLQSDAHEETHDETELAKAKKNALDEAKNLAILAGIEAYRAELALYHAEQQDTKEVIFEKRHFKEAQSAIANQALDAIRNADFDGKDEMLDKIHAAINAYITERSRTMLQVMRDDTTMRRRYLDEEDGSLTSIDDDEFDDIHEKSEASTSHPATDSPALPLSKPEVHQPKLTQQALFMKMRTSPLLKQGRESEQHSVSTDRESVTNSPLMDEVLRKELKERIGEMHQILDALDLFSSGNKQSGVVRTKAEVSAAISAMKDRKISVPYIPAQMRALYMSAKSVSEALRNLNIPMDIFSSEEKFRQEQGALERIFAVIRDDVELADFYAILQNYQPDERRVTLKDLAKEQSSDVSPDDTPKPPRMPGLMSEILKGQTLKKPKDTSLKDTKPTDPLSRNRLFDMARKKSADNDPETPTPKR